MPKIRQLQPPKLPAIAQIPKASMPLVRRGLRPKILDLAAQVTAETVVPPGLVATIPEWLVYQWLQKHGVRFDFQSSLMGGRIELGGAVADFVLPELGMIWRVQGCPGADERVLTADLRWVRAGDLQMGDRLASFVQVDDQQNHLWRWATGIVTANSVDEGVSSRRVHFENGQSVVCTPTHPWLARRRKVAGLAWRETDKLQRPWLVPQFLPTWVEETSYSAGWLAGFFDGEGNLAQSSKRGEHATWHQIRAGQVYGQTFDYLCQTLKSVGVPYSVYDTSRGHRLGWQPAGIVHLLGGVAGITSFLGRFRPQRLLSKFRWEEAGSLRGKVNLRIVAVEPCVAPIARLSVSTGTYILQGFGAHNTQWHIGDPGKEASDLVQKIRLTDEGYTVIDLYDTDILQNRDLVCRDALAGREWRKPIV